MHKWRCRRKGNYGSNTADGSFFFPPCIPGNDARRYRKRICRFCFLWTPVSMASISQVEREKEREWGGRERLGGGREQKHKKALDCEEGRREVERMRSEWVTASRWELQTERWKGLWSHHEVGGTEGGEVSYKTREWMGWRQGQRSGPKQAEDGEESRL